jgi:hypothetical protein
MPYFSSSIGPSESGSNRLSGLSNTGLSSSPAYDALDRFFHAVEAGEGRIEPHRAVQKDTAKARILGRVDHLRLADRS